MREINPDETSRAEAFRLWMNAPMPMVTLFKTLDVTNLARTSKRKGLKFNMLMCWCIGKAASRIKEFYLLPVGNKLFQYDSLAVNTIVANWNGEVSSCDIPFSDNLRQFNNDYLQLTRQVAESCRNHDIADSMVIGTSAMVQYDIDGAVEWRQNDLYCVPGRNRMQKRCINTQKILKSVRLRTGLPTHRSKTVLR